VKPPPFAYAAPGGTGEALDCLAENPEESKLLAGGQSLVPLLNMRLAQPQVLIDLNRIPELRYIRPAGMDGRTGMAFGAMTRQRAIEHADQTLARLPLLRDAIRWIGHPQIRNRGTIGGSIAHADPSAELPVVFRCLDGVATVRSRSARRLIPAAEFFVYAFTPAIEPDEILTEVWLPLPAPWTGQAFVEAARRHGDFALVAAAVSLTLDEAHRITDVRIALGGAAPLPVRASPAEAMLRGEAASLELFREAGAAAAREADPTSDVHADAEYRREVADALTFRALELAFERAGSNDA
jgi:CO/xanthine dehydrogenase FAD-binding subunit